MTVPDTGNRSSEDIVLEAEQHINEKAATFNTLKYKNVSNKLVRVGIKIYVDGSKGSIRLH